MNILIRDGKNTQRNRGEGHVKTEAEIGALLPQPRKLGATRIWKRQARLFP